MYVICQYYNDPNIERVKEYLAALNFNLMNKNVIEVHDIIEPHTIIPKNIAFNKKHKTIKIEEIMNNHSNTNTRLTFDIAFKYANNFLPKNSIVVLTNLDVFLHPICNSFDTIREDFFDYHDRLNYNCVLCLSRHEYDWDNTLTKDPAAYYGSSQDCWIFKTPITIENATFAVGNAPFCDGAISGKFLAANYKVYNWADKYITCHIDRCRNTHNPNKHSGGNMILNKNTDYTAKDHYDQLSGFICPYIDYNLAMKHLQLQLHFCFGKEKGLTCKRGFHDHYPKMMLVNPLQKIFEDEKTQSRTIQTDNSMMVVEYVLRYNPEFVFVWGEKMYNAILNELNEKAKAENIEELNHEDNRDMKNENEYTPQIYKTKTSNIYLIINMENMENNDNNNILTITKAKDMIEYAALNNSTRFSFAQTPLGLGVNDSQTDESLGYAAE